MLILLVALPILVVVYGQPSLIAPGLVMIAVLPAGVLSTPLWVFYRRMDFLRQRAIQAIDPVIGFIVAIVMAALGAGYWALAGGVLAGAYATAIAALIVAPYKLRIKYDRGTMRSYFSFSWPLFVANGSSTVIAQSAVITRRGGARAGRGRRDGPDVEHLVVHGARRRADHGHPVPGHLRRARPHRPAPGVVQQVQPAP